MKLFFASFILFVMLQTSCCQVAPIISSLFTILHNLGVKNADPTSLQAAKNGYIKQFSARTDYMERGQEDLPFYKIFPKYLASVPPGEVLEFNDMTCFHNLKLSTSLIHTDEIELTIQHTESDNLLCHRSFVISTGAHTEILELWGNGDKTITLKSDGSPEQDWDLLERGPRVFVYLMTPETLTYNIGATMALFEAEFFPEITQTAEDMNREFLKSYVGIDMPLRPNAPEILDIPEEIIKNGDTINILRMNGLAPLIGYAMGSATGHTAVAMWRSGRLYICESTTVSSCWPTNGMQCNPYSTWIEWAHGCQYQAVFAPLDRSAGEELMDMDKAWELVDRLVGLDYGYKVVVSGWLDTVRDNLPCPGGKDQNLCLEPEHFELLFHYAEKLSPVLAQVFVPMIQQRVGVLFNTTLLQAYHQAAIKMNLDPIDIYSIPEETGWLYETTRDGHPVMGESMVCNDFVCNVWKAGGLFKGKDVNCAESGVNDNYKLNIYQDPELRPDICKEVDPENPNCQLVGKYSLRLDSQPGVLPRYNYVEPADDIFESCPSMAPDYLAPQNC